MYTAQLLKVVPDSNFPNISVCTIQFFKDGVAFGAPDDERGFTQDQLTDYCKQKIQKLQTDDDQQTGMEMLINTPPIGDIDVTTVPADELLQQTVNQVLQLKQMIDLGILDPNDPNYLSLINQAKATAQSQNAQVSKV
jgi:hypothetical protein